MLLNSQIDGTAVRADRPAQSWTALVAGFHCGPLASDRSQRDDRCFRVL